MDLRGVVVLLLVTSAGVGVMLSVSACSPKCGCGLRAHRGAGNTVGCALSKDALTARQSAIRDLLAGNVLAWRELPDGFAFELPGDDETAHRVFDTVLLERRCCTFVRFDLSFEPQRGSLHLEMRTDPTNKPVLRDLLEPAGAFIKPPSS